MKMEGVDVPPERENFTFTEDRLATFIGWPVGLAQTPSLLAEAGFIYQGFGDMVLCYSCRTHLCAWQADDCVWTEHIVHSKGHCMFLKTVRTDESMQKVIEKASQNQIFFVIPE